MEDLLVDFRERGARNAPKERGTNVVWQRLAFPYRYQAHLTYRDIIERAEPTRPVAGFERNAGTRSVGLASARLLTRVAWQGRAGQEGVGDAD